MSYSKTLNVNINGKYPSMVPKYNVNLTSVADIGLNLILGDVRWKCQFWHYLGTAFRYIKLPLMSLLM